jgi:hypothetical protein
VSGSCKYDDEPLGTVATKSVGYQSVCQSVSQIKYSASCLSMVLLKVVNPCVLAGAYQRFEGT